MSSEYLVRSVGPSLVIVVEREGPTRLFTTLTGEADLAALQAWIEDSEARRVLVGAALDDAAAGGERGEAWARSLAQDPGGIVAAVERLADRLSPESEGARAAS